MAFAVPFTIASIIFSVFSPEMIAAQNNSVKDILAEIDEIAGVSTKLEEHFDME